MTSAKMSESIGTKQSEKFYATGRRKEATARVWITKGTGKIVINSRDINGYLDRPILRMVVEQPFVVTETANKYDVWCTVKGSGTAGQAGAIKHGISRALDKIDESLHGALKSAGFLTRDSRVVERKKYGHKKARKRFQFCKR